MKKLFPLVMAVLMVGSAVLMVMVIRGKTSAQNLRDQSKQLIEQANAATSKAQAELEKAEQIAQGMHEQFSKLKEEYDRITSIIVDPVRAPSEEELEKARASTAKVKAELKKTQTELDVARRMVAELREGLRPPVVGKPTRPPSRGKPHFTIQSHDLTYDFYIISGGSDNGIKIGDKLTVFRAEKEIGKIEISRTQPFVSIAVYQKGFPRPSAPFRNGDKVINIPPLIADPPTWRHTILSRDLINDFYVIRGGSDNGIKIGDKLLVFRAEKEIGKIEITRTQPTFSIAVYQKGFPRPSAPFKAGDRLMKIN